MNININLTASKVLAYLILISGVTYGFMFKSADVIMAAFTASGVVIAIKSASTAYSSVNSTTTKIEGE